MIMLDFIYNVSVAVEKLNQNENLHSFYIYLFMLSAGVAAWTPSTCQKNPPSARPRTVTREQECQDQEEPTTDVSQILSTMEQHPGVPGQH